MNNDSYRLGVGVMLLNKDKKVFVGKRKDIKKDSWQMPQGGIQKGEKEEDAALRELFEETGVKKVKMRDIKFGRRDLKKKKKNKKK